MQRLPAAPTRGGRYRHHKALAKASAVSGGASIRIRYHPDIVDIALGIGTTRQKLACVETRTDSARTLWLPDAVISAAARKTHTIPAPPCRQQRTSIRSASTLQQAVGKRAASLLRSFQTHSVRESPSIRCFSQSGSGPQRGFASQLPPFDSSRRRVACKKRESRNPPVGLSISYFQWPGQVQSGQVAATEVTACQRHWQLPPGGMTPDRDSSGDRRTRPMADESDSGSLTRGQPRRRQHPEPEAHAAAGAAAGRRGPEWQCNPMRARP
jgi:hypothetical protein